MVTTASDGLEFDRFFRAEYPKLVSIALGLTGDYETSCELAQEALLRCHRSWDRVAGLDVPGAWLRRVLINLATDVHRFRRRERRVPDWARGDGESRSDDPVIDGWWSAVRELPERQRAVVVLHYVEDMSVLDVAAVLGVREGTVKTSLARARQTLAKTLPRET